MIFLDSADKKSIRTAPLSEISPFVTGDEPEKGKGPPLAQDNPFPADK